ncbi:MAG: DUF11 domain-containing protein [Cytophagales bacterium]|nr:MAG: DUF11 domain-containing protein [Cytophagales bacterium]
MNVLSTFKTEPDGASRPQSVRCEPTTLPGRIGQWVLVVAQLIRTLGMVARSWVDAASPPDQFASGGPAPTRGRRTHLPTTSRYAFGMRVDPPDRISSTLTSLIPIYHNLSSFPMNEQPLLKNSLALIRMLWQHCVQGLPFGSKADSVCWAEDRDRFASSPPPRRSAAQRSGSRPREWALTGGLLASFTLSLLSFGAIAQSADVSVDAQISNPNPALNGTVTYTVTVVNSATTAASNVLVKVALPAGYVNATGYVASTGAPSYSASSGNWAIASLAASSSATLQITATILERGVAFMTAEVIASGTPDADSNPNNGSYLEDDLDNACFSVPLLYYSGDEYTVSAPAGFSGVQYYKDGNLVGSASVPATEASLDGSGNLVIKSVGTYSVQASLSGCQATNCCNIIVVPGPLASLGDYVWLDNNKDGQQGTAALEPPVQGVTVQLYQPGSTSALSTTVTGSDGKYLFSNLIPGEYYVVFTAPNGMTYTSPNSGTDATDSDADAVTGRTQTYTLAGGDQNLTVDAGLIPLPASLGDYVWLDNNGNGVQDPGESGVQGVTVTLYSNGSAVATTTTSASGLYSFTGLAPGDYQVVFTAPVGTTFTQPNGTTNTAQDSNVTSTTGQLGGTSIVSLTAGQNNPTIDAGLIPLKASLGDYVWYDNNSDGQQGPAAQEPPVPGVVAQLYQPGTPTPIASTTTNTSGFYSFTGLDPGQYYVVFTAPNGSTFTTPNSGTDTSDSDVASLTGQLGSTGIYSLTAGENNPTVDAGLIPLKASLGNYVWLDTNKNGTQDPTETGVANVTVTLFSNGSALATQTTSTSGTYLFTNLDPGQYSVVFTAPGGMTFTTPNSSTVSDALDSDAASFTGQSGSTGVYSLTAGEQNLTVDAGLIPVSASLGDYVWLDNNGNGVQDPGEPGVPAVTVTLYSNGSAVATTTTSASGLYSFTGLAPGNYQVVFTAPVGTTFTQPNGTTNTATDSNVNSFTGQLGGTSIVSLSAGENNPTIDAGLIPLKASLGDYVWYDNNSDGQQGPAAQEPPVPGVVAQLYQPGTPTPLASTTTNSSGFYSFTGLDPGQYYVVFTAPNGSTFTQGLQGNTGTDSNVNSLTGQMGSTPVVSLTAGQHDPTIDAGLIPLKASLGNYVWLDTNKNGTQDPTETGVANVTVTLFSNGSALATQTTSASGTYLFTNLDPGQYSVVFTAPGGMTFTTGNAPGVSDALDSDAASFTGQSGSTGVYSLTAGEQNLTVDAGLIPLPASLGDFVWSDNNGNGVQDPGESGVPGVTVSLYNNGTLVATTTTNGSGGYSFTGLTPGDYQVVFTAPVGMTFSPPNGTTNTANDSNVTSTTGQLGGTSIVSLTAGQNNPTIDAGLIPLKASLGNYVWLDTNKNGTQDTGEAPVAGVTVTLFSNGSAIATQVTSASGLYLFTNLDPGQYSVVFTAPNGHTFTTPNASGVSDALDSDAASFTGQNGSTGVYSLSAGEQNLTVDAGLIPLPASLGDYVWLDQNGNGVQDPGENGVSGIGVTLYDAASGTVVGTMTTSSTGFYSFTGLNPGSYYVVFTGPAGTTYTTPNGTTNTAQDSNVTSTTGGTGRTGVVSLTAGENNPTIDAGILPVVASLGDYVWLDMNQDGQQGPAAQEPPVPGVLVQLYVPGGATPIASTTTNTSGFYSFTGLAPGSYQVVFTAPPGTTFTQGLQGNPATDSNVNSLTGQRGGTAVVSLSANENNPTIDAGLIPLKASLGNYVWQDTNGNGQQDPSEMGVSGVTVTLFSNGSAIATQTTSTSGTYLFTNLDPGQYSVVFTTPNGYTFTTPNATGVNDAQDSDAASFTGQSGSTGVYSLTAGEQNLTVDAGLVPQPASLGNYVWNDTNGNGIQDPTETGVPSVTVTLYSNGVVVGTQVTNATGGYLFTGLMPGNYSVVFTAPAGMTFTQPNGTTNTATDSNVNSTTGQLGGTSVVSLSAGEVNTTIDAGLIPVQASLGDYVWSDTNGNGIQDPTEVGVPGVTVTLYNAVTNAPLSVTTTSATGGYLFTGLTPGSYYVVFTTPTGFTLTAQNATTNTATDSNANPTTGRTNTVTLVGGESNLTIDAGLVPNAPPVTCPGAATLVVSNANICEGAVATITATGPAGSTIRIYLTPTGANGLVGTMASGASLTVQPSTTTVYYAEVVGAEVVANCPRTPVAVEVTRKPPTPTCPERLTVCIGRTTINLTTVYSSTTTGSNTFEWRTGLQPTSPLVSNVTAAGQGKYYLFERSANGCYSNPAILTIDGENCDCRNPATIALGPGRSVCEGAPVVLVATLGGGATSVTWTSTGSGTFVTAGLSATYTPSAADANNEFVTITGTTNDPDGAGVCTTASSNVVVDINERPEAPVGVACDDELVCQGQSTKLIGFSAQGARINWYGPNNTFLGQTASAGKLTVTPTGTTVYYAEAVSEDGCVSATRSSVTVVVGQCKADLAVTAVVTPGGTYSVGQTVTYVITACNNGPATGENVAVSFPLPSSVEYVSNTPGQGTYNPATGSWSLGTMPSGTCKNLFVEVVIRGTGTISATAVITGTNDDPTKPGNNSAVVSFPVPEAPCNVAPPHITCAITDICVGERTTLNAEGCAGNVVWSNGQSGTAISVSPRVTTTYTASCVVGRCTSTASNAITIRLNNPVKPTIMASTNSVCAGGVVSLTATGCEGGAILWSTGATGSVISTTINGRTTITANCRIGNCLSEPAEKIIDLSNDIPKPTVTCSTTVICPGESVELSTVCAVGTPLWSTGATTARITVYPTDGNNSYNVSCVNGSCRSAQSDNYVIRIIRPTVPVVTASSSTICAGSSVTLTASGCAEGTIQWSTRTTGNTLIVNPITNISYFATCKVRECISEASAPVALVVVNPTPPSVRRPSKPIVCSGESVTLTADGCAAGTIVWNTGQTGSSIVIMPTETKTYSASCQIGSCRSAGSNGEVVTVNTTPGAAPMVTASSTVTCGTEPITLTATGCASGTVIWSDGQTGSVVTVTPTATMNEFYAVCRSTTACGTARSNTIRVRITTVPTPTVICSESVICPGEAVELTAQNCTGTPMWSTGESTATITVRPQVTTGYSLTCKSGACVSAGSNVYTITVIKPAAPTVTASATLVQPGQSVTLTANCSVGTPVWSNNATTNSIVVSVTGTQSFQAFCKYRTCLSEGSTGITVTTDAGCQVAPGTLRTESGTICAGGSNTVTITAIPNGGQVVPTGYSVLYVLTKGTDLIIQKTSTTPGFVVNAENATYRVHTLVYNANATDPNFLDLSVVQPGTTPASAVLSLIASRKICAALDATGVPVQVKVVAPPTIVGPSLTICAGSSVTLTAQGCEGGTIRWMSGQTGNILVLNAVTEMVWQNATCTIDGCTSKPSESYDIDVIVPRAPTVTCDKPTICIGEQTTLQAVGCAGGTFQWESGETTASITVTPTVTANTYRVRCQYGACFSDYSPACKVNVGGPNAPTISIQSSGSTVVTNATNCFGAPITLVATGCPAGAYAIWSNGDAGNRITVSPSRSITYTAQCCTSNNCKSSLSNIVTISVGPKIVPPVTRDLTNTCPFQTVNLAGGVTSTPTTTGGVIEYYTSSTPKADDRVSNPGAVGRSGAYYAFEKTTSGCYSLGSVINVRISACEGQAVPCDKNPLTANAGRDDKICAAKAYKLSGSTTGEGVSVQWTTSGTGKFDDPFAANATYLPSEEDVKAGKVTLTLAARVPNSTCGDAKDGMELTIEGVKETPTIRTIGSVNACAGDSVILEASAGDSYMWSNRATGNRIVVKTSGTYSVQAFDKAGCSSLKSNEVVVTVGESSKAPYVTNLRNTCPATTVDLTKAISEAAAAGTTYAFRMGTSPTSGLVMRPDAVGEGTYYAFRSNAAGCVSAPAAIEVKVFNCATDTARADLAITKTASKTALNRGEVITYTISVQNKGPKAASNVNVRDILPAGLELVPGANGNYNVSNGAVTKWWGVVAANATETITFQARATKKGEIVNTAEITYADQQDPDMTNNKSSVTVTDTSSARPGRVGLAKAVTSQKMVGTDTFDVEYAFRLTNYGDTDLTNVQVTDDLKAVFGSHTISEVAVATTDADNFKLTFNPAFLTGDSKMFDGKGTLKASATTYFFLSARVKLDAANANRTFSNSATASATSDGVTTEDASVNGADADPDGDGNPNNNAGSTVFTLEEKQAPVNPIGVALAVTSTEKQPDNSYNVGFQVVVKNFGEKGLENVSLMDSLSKAFPTPASFSLVSGPTANAGSSLQVNTGFNGTTNTNILAPGSTLATGKSDTIRYVINVTPNGNNGPFYSSITGTATVASTSVTVTDRSNVGVDPAPAGNMQTPVRFDLPEALLGVAKSVGTPVMVEPGIYDVAYTIKLTNLGTADLKKVQIVDNLSNTFNRGALIVDNRVKVTADAGLKVDSLYSGQGLMTKILVDTLSTLPKGASRSVSFKVRVNVKNADSLTFYNSAVGMAYTPGGVMVADTSTAGANPDPNNNLDPRTANNPTPVVLNSVGNSYIGLALAVKDTLMKADGSYDVSFIAVVKNFGTAPMTNVSVTDTLAKVFTDANGSSFRVVGTPIASRNSGLMANTGFDGSSDVRLILPQSSSLAGGRTDTLTFMVNVRSNGLTSTFLNSAYATALADGVTVRDISTNGLNPDPSGNRNPTDAAESEATPVVLGASDQAVFIPEGFSPNGDGINDVFTIRGAESQAVKLEVFNRWGHTVYKSDDYKNDWSGTSNTGVLKGNTAGLPDGTYFYRVQLESGRTYVRFMTINR